MSEEAKGQEQEQEKDRSASEMLQESIEPSHREATCIAYTSFLVNGVEINFTMREGATAESTKALLLQMGWVSKWLKGEMKATPIWGRDTRETIARHARRKGNGNAQEKPKQPPAPAPLAPPQAAPPPPPAAGAPPPAPGQAAAPATDVNVNKVTVEDIDFIRITAPDGKAVVEFRRKGRDYPEVRWQRGGAKLLEVAPALASAGYVAGHFDIESVGKEYHMPMKVSWIPSPKNPKWRDLTKVEVTSDRGQARQRIDAALLGMDTCVCAIE